MRSQRVIHAVDSHTEGMPTRVVTGGVGVIPGATMAERRQWFIENSDDLRTLLMYEPRGHSAMSGAILQPPTRPDADYGVLFIEVSGLLPMCGHGTIGVATVLVETGMVAVTEPVTTIRLDTPAGLVVASGARRGRRGARGHDPQRALVQPRPGPAREGPRLRRGPLRHRVRRELLRDRQAGRSRLAVRPRGEERLARRRAWRSWTRSTRQTSRCTPSGRTSTAATTSTSRHPARPPGTPGTRWPSTPAGSTGRRAAPAPAPGWPSCTRAASWPWVTNWSTSRSSARGSSGGIAGTTEVAGRAAVVPEITGRAWVTGTAQYHLDPERPVPARLPALMRLC